MLTGGVAIAIKPIAMDLYEFNSGHTWSFVNELIGDVLITDPEPSSQVTGFRWEL